MEKQSIKNWALDDRPREKLMAKGIQSLSDAELVAILIGSGTRNESAVDLAKYILNTCNNNLNELGKKDIKSLTSIRGMGPAKSINILSALELGRRRKLADIIDRKKIGNSKDVFDIFHSIIADLPHEEFWVLLLNQSNKILEKQKISQGGVSGTVTDVKIILKLAIENLASSVILCHNHPSGNLKPSKADVEITKKLREAARLMDIVILDHIIISDESYFSFADEGMI